MRYACISNLCSSYPPQIPLTFTSNHHTTHYLDLTLSPNHFTIKSHRVHHQIYQKPHHKYMYPHFSSNHPHHIFAGIIKTETIRYSRLSATIDDYNFIHHLFTLRLTALDYPLQLITEHSFPWITRTAHQRRLKNKQTNNVTRPTVYYKTLYNKDKRTDKLVNNILLKYHNPHIPKLSKAYCNSTKLHTLLLTNKMLHHKLILFNNSTTYQILHILYLYTYNQNIYLPAANFPFAKSLLVIYTISMGSSSTTMYIVSPLLMRFSI